MNSRNPIGPRGGFVLLAAILLLALLIAVSAQLATTVGAEALIHARLDRGLQHELAVASVGPYLADRLMDASQDISALLDRSGVAEFDFKLGDVSVNLWVRDDATKLNPVLFDRPDQHEALQQKLRRLQTQFGLLEAEVRVRPLPEDRSGAALRRFVAFDQLVYDAAPGAFFRWKENESAGSVWSDLLTFWGDGRIDLRRADVQVLDVILEDLRPGLARKLLAARPTDRSTNFLGAALAAVDGEVRERVARRVTYGTCRYAVRVDTVAGADQRRWFMVIECGGHRPNVLYQGKVTW